MFEPFTERRICKIECMNLDYQEIMANYEPRLATFPYPELGTLKYLTIELRDDEADSGWDILKAAAPDLLQLYINLCESNRTFLGDTPPSSYHDPYDDYKPTYHPNVWAVHLIAEIPSFTNLTSLTIVTQYRFRIHLICFLLIIPNLRDLTLKSNGRLTDTAEYYTMVSIPRDLRLFETLETITLSGPDHIIDEAVEEVVWRCQRLRAIIIQVFDPYEDNEGELDLPSKLCRISSQRLLKELAIYGSLT